MKRAGMNRWRNALLIGAAGLVGCAPAGTDPAGDPPVPVAVREKPAADDDADESGPTEAIISGFRFDVPPGWRQAELTPAQQGFIDARFEIPKYGDDVKLTLSTIGGGVQANIERWIGQFRLPEGVTPGSEAVEVDGLSTTIVDLRGEFQGMRQAPQPGWRMLGAAFDGEPRDFYIKLTGPEQDVSELDDDFQSFVKSARRTLK